MSRRRRKVLKAPLEPAAAKPESVAASPEEPSSRQVSALDVSAKVIEQEVHSAHQTAQRIVEEAEARGRLRLAEAEDEASRQRAALAAELEALREDAEASARRMQAAARDAGYAEGLARWQELLAAGGRETEERLRELERQVVELAISIGAKLYRKQIEVDTDAVVVVVEDALRALGGHGREIRVLVHDDDLASVEHARSDLVALDPRFRAMAVVADDSIERGGCRVESEAGSVDATVEAQLRAIEEHLLPGVQDASTEVRSQEP